ncbi:MAG: putative Ig domain-containing protein, partial [Burkholderiales bacterium]|nr:putative Ig domain-containing protein [Burkholderiales bacterium]
WYTDDTFWFSCAPSALKARNLRANPHVVVTTHDTVEFVSQDGVAAAAIARASIRLVATNSDVHLAYGPAGDRILLGADPRGRIETIRIRHVNGASQVTESFAFDSLRVEYAGGLGSEVLVGVEGYGNDLSGGDGNDVLLGTARDDVLAGGRGNDLMRGGEGADLYRVGPGEGIDTIEDDGTFGDDTLVVGARVADTHLTVLNGTFFLAIGAEGDGVRIRGFDPLDALAPGAIERFVFADGPELGYGALVGRGFDFAGTGGADVLAGTSVADRFDAKAGNDRMFGGRGNDTYVFGQGYGRDVIVDRDLTDGNSDTIYFKSDIDRASLRVERLADRLRFSVEGTDDSLDVQWDPREGYRIERVAFGADGAIWDLGHLERLANRAPVLAAPLADQRANKGEAFSAVIPAGTFTDADGDAPHYSLTLADGGALPAWLSYDAASRTLAGTPGAGDVGAVAVRVTAADRFGATASDVFVIDVTGDGALPAGGNRAPELRMAIGALAATEDAAFEFALPAGTFVDPDAGDVLAYGATRADGTPLPSWLSVDRATGTLRGTPANGDVGTVDVRLAATDAAGAVASATFALSVANTNDAPVLVAPVADQMVREDSPFSLALPAGMFADEDVGDALALAAAQADGAALPGWLRFDPATRRFFGTPANGDVGTVSIRVMATDAAGARASDVFDLTVVNTNDAPTLAVPVVKQSTREDAPFCFTLAPGTFADADAGDRLTLAAMLANGVALPGWLAFDAATGTFRGTPENGDVGAYEIKVVATDLAGESAEARFAIAVENVNDAPVYAAPAIGAQRADAGLAFSLEIAEDAFADVDAGDSLTFSARLASGEALPSWLAFDPATRRFSGVATNADAGTLAIVVTAADRAGASASTSFELDIVRAPNLLLYGTSGNDVLVGGAGNDTLNGNRGADRLYGMAGNDSLAFTADARWASGTRRVNAGSPGVVGTGEAVDIGNFNRSFDLFDGGAGYDTLYATDGRDAILLDDDSGALGAAGPRLAGIEAIFAGRGDDLIDLTSARYAYGPVLADGGDGDDIVWGSAGDDVIYGGRGNDRLFGGAGNDYLASDGGADTLNGGAGNDIMQGEARSDVLVDVFGSNLFMGMDGADDLMDGAAASFFVGGRGNDRITLGGGADVIAFNRGDGRDVIRGTATATLSLGGGIRYQDLLLRVSGTSLIVDVGENERVTFQDWYAAPANRSVVNLQLVVEAMQGYGQAALNPLYSDRIANFDFTRIVAAFDAARAASGISRWQVMNSLLDAHLGSSDTAALGGDLAYRYGLAGSLAGLAVPAVGQALNAGGFGTAAQELRPLDALQQGDVKLV